MIRLCTGTFVQQSNAGDIFIPTQVVLLNFVERIYHFSFLAVYFVRYKHLKRRKFLHVPFSLRSLNLNLTKSRKGLRSNRVLESTSWSTVLEYWSKA